MNDMTVPMKAYTKFVLVGVVLVLLLCLLVSYGEHNTRQDIPQYHVDSSSPERVKRSAHRSFRYKLPLSGKYGDIKVEKSKKHKKHDHEEDGLGRSQGKHNKHVKYHGEDIQGHYDKGENIVAPHHGITPNHDTEKTKRSVKVATSEHEMSGRRNKLSRDAESVVHKPKVHGMSFNETHKKRRSGLLGSNKKMSATLDKSLKNDNKTNKYIPNKKDIKDHHKQKPNHRKEIQIHDNFEGHQKVIAQDKHKIKMEKLDDIL